MITSDVVSDILDYSQVLGAIASGIEHDENMSRDLVEALEALKYQLDKVEFYQPELEQYI